YRATTGTTKENNQYPHTVYRQWFGNPLARLNLDATPNERLKISLGFEGNVFLSTFDPDYLTEKSSNGGLPIIPQFMDWRLHQAQGIFSFLNYNWVTLDMAIGLMPYKYNPEVRNLGEFMFRSGTYPLYLTTEFNFPMARLSGIRAGLAFHTDKFDISVDEFILTERQNPPLNDVSIASIASVNILKLVEIGVGLNFARVIPVNNELTTPKRAFYLENGDTAYYSFQGTKIMGRMTVDPFGKIRGKNAGTILNDFLGENGGKLYGEVLVSGTKNYPANATGRALDFNSAINKFGYENIAERMPWMVGINIPFWKILDVCAFEIEKFPAPYPNDYYQAQYNAVLPIPTWIPEMHESGDTTYDSTLYTENAKKYFYWSLYVKKQIVSNLSLIGQISRDHMRWKCNLGNSANYDTEEILAKPHQWAWRIGFLYNF
ncbi:MAG: hypothetical protein JW863_05585, partial [Chitinispirillaceae bacterium]|nr:hypothetical protein [Chitinispirillaceae bacterium]